MKILYNARIHTFDQVRQEASVLVIDRDRVAALGGSELFDIFGARASREGGASPGRVASDRVHADGARGRSFATASSF